MRAELLGRPDIALRLMVAHVIAGSGLWRIVVEPQNSKSDAVRESVENCRAEAVFDARRREVLALLHSPDDEPTVIGGTGYGMRGGRRALCDFFARLIVLSDAEVMAVLALVMGEAVEAASPAVEAAGLAIGVPMADWREADDAFLDTLRHREVLVAIAAEVAGKLVADANRQEKAKTLRAILRGHLAGEGGRTKVAGWVPRWMAFAPSAYTARGGVGTVAAHARAFAVQDADDEAEEGAEVGAEGGAEGEVAAEDADFELRQGEAGEDEVGDGESPEPESLCDPALNPVSGPCAGGDRLAA